jgi:ribokinase
MTTQPKYAAMIGTGGIGSGAFFALDGDRTLGREESRTGHFLDQRDYCKLHIVCHYMARLMGPDFPVIPIGGVGDDETGERLLLEMAEVGLDLRHVRCSQGLSTMYAFCLIYPDGSGCNLTTADSACDQVDFFQMLDASDQFSRYAGRGLAVALPEVPLDARSALLRLASDHDFLRVASFNSRELQQLRSANLERDRHTWDDWLDCIDLLALNLDEAATLTAHDAESADPEDIVAATVALLPQGDRLVMATVTAGAQGSWASDGSTVRHMPAISGRVASTAGAGDAHLAGILAGLASGLTLHQSHELAAIVAGMSVTSPHTIHDGITRESLPAFARSRCRPLSEAVSDWLFGDDESECENTDGQT